MPAQLRQTVNDTEDRLAKMGKQALQTQNPVTYREAKTLLHSQFKGYWKKDFGGFLAQLDPIRRLGAVPADPHFSDCGQGTVI